MRASLRTSASPSILLVLALFATAACSGTTRELPPPPTDLGGDPLDLGTTPNPDLGTAPDPDLGTTPGGEPDAVGPYAVSQSSTTVAGAPVTVFDPTLPSGVLAPISLFMPGFQLTVARYAPLCERLASHGVIVIGVDATGGISPNHVALRDASIAVLDWARGTAPSAAHTDLTHTLVFGHSLGGKLATMMAALDGRVTALLAIDPVNAGSPLTGYTATLPNIVPDSVTPLTIPVGFLGETTNSSGGTLGMSCAPAAQNFQTFYAAATGTSWAAQWNFIGADHMDFVPDTASCGFVCTSCTAGTTDAAAVVSAMQTLTVAFAQRHLFGDVGAQAWLTGASLPPGIVMSSRP
jgi:pimeloyl-ACP methyl ester carboxylesterase